eukprot:COSAG05_NODE_3516_length_2015_cov_1.828810_2_plen_205_part_00
MLRRWAHHQCEGKHQCVLDPNDLQFPRYPDPLMQGAAVPGLHYSFAIAATCSGGEGNASLHRAPPPPPLSASRPSAECQAEADTLCNARCASLPVQKACMHESDGSMVARNTTKGVGRVSCLSGICREQEWRCYAPSSLTPDLQNYNSSGSDCLCSYLPGYDEVPMLTVVQALHACKYGMRFSSRPNEQPAPILSPRGKSQSGS